VCECDTTEIALSSWCSVTDRVDNVKQAETNGDGMIKTQSEFTRKVPNYLTINLMMMMMICDNVVTAVMEDDF
jgi:hypothetical protein